MELTRDHAVKVLEVVDQGLVKGMGVAKPGEMCVEAAVCFALGLPHGDDPSCVGKAVRAYKIGLNDTCDLKPKERSKLLRKLAVAQLGSNQIDQTKFANLLTLRTIQRIVPVALRSAEEIHPDKAHKDKLEEAAKACEITTELSAAYSAARSAASARFEVFQLAVDICVEVLKECDSPGCEWLDLCE